MKNFANINPTKVQELVEQLKAEYHVLPATEDAYITAIEYIAEMWRMEYDDDDIELIVDNLYFEPANGTVHILELTGFEEEEPTLFFEKLYNPYWKPYTKWEVVLETDISLTEVDKMIAYANQGWINVGNFEHLSYMITLHNYLTVETVEIEMYVDAVNRIGGDIKIVDYYPAEFVTYPIPRRTW